MSETQDIRSELIQQRRKPERKNKTFLDAHETIIIIAALLALTISLLSGKVTEGSYSTLMAGFMGYTFGRIFNGWQGKE
jgi:hypothetical protein